VKAGTHIFFVLKQRKNNGNKKAMPHLGLEAATPTETEKAITALEEENRELKDHITRLEASCKKCTKRSSMKKFNKKNMKNLEEHPEIDERDEQMYKQHQEMLRKDKEFLAKHPEERKRREKERKKQNEEYEKYLEEHEEQIEEEIKQLEASIRLDERRKTLKELQDRELQDIIKKANRTKKITLILGLGVKI